MLERRNLGLKDRKGVLFMTTSFGYTDKVATTKNVAVPQLSYAADFSVKAETSSEVVLTNTTSPLDQPETIRFALEPVRNVYNGTAIDPSAQSTSKNGVSLLVQVNDILRVSPETGESGCCCGDGAMDFPISTHIVIKTPLVQYIDADTVLSVVKRNISALFGEGTDVTSARLNSMLRGALKPSTM